MSTAITQRAELVDPASNVVDAAVAITISAAVVGFTPLGFVVTGLRPVLS